MPGQKQPRTEGTRVTALKNASTAPTAGTAEALVSVAHAIAGFVEGHIPSQASVSSLASLAKGARAPLSLTQGDGSERPSSTAMPCEGNIQKFPGSRKMPANPSQE